MRLSRNISVTLLNMGLFGGQKTKDVIFLQPVRYSGEKIPRGRIRMLYCDITGKLYASVMSKSVYELARRNASLRTGGKAFATIGLETVEGRFIPTTVSVNDEEAWALERILEHALSHGQIPYVLHKYLRPIIRKGNRGREAVIAAKNKPRKNHAKPVPVVPKVLNRLPYYPERDIEVSMPIYKAAYAYPLLMLKRLEPDEQTPAGMQRVLILDSDGDMAITRVPTRLIRKIELELIEEERKNRHPVRVLITGEDTAQNVEYLPVNQEQHKALETLTRYYEQTGSSKERVSAAVQTVLAKAKDSIAPEE